MKPGPWIQFSARRDVLMAGHVGQRVLLRQGKDQVGQGLVLRRREGVAFQALKFYTDGVVVAVVPPPVARWAGVPGAVVATDKLPQATVTADEKVGRDLQAPDGLEVRVGVPVELVAKQLPDFGATIDTRRQADGMQHQQVNRGLWRSGAKVG